MSFEHKVKLALRSFFLVLFLGGSLAGCNTMEGVGEDVEQAGENMEEEAED
ncbi:entericidin A/B family lipoprotein [Marinobacter fonticola]|uniref:entericidin A/B family lipoprotein n=1 Tax=Marinobacter fonticola TaxID=2603215 RepID=UPI0011E7A877|nr:entericidin A/B family lipoprotein [Marinobacter fonticola]